MKSVRFFKDKYVLVQPILGRAVLNVFQVAPKYNEDRAPVWNDLGEHLTKLVCNFPFQWTKKHFDRKLETYVWKEGQLGNEDQTSFARLAAFVARIPLV